MIETITQENDETPKESDNHGHHGSISTIVFYTLLFVGLFAEYFAIINILDKHTANTLGDSMGVLMFLAKASVIIMLAHQFLIIRNFHILDHISPKDYKTYNIGKWVSECGWEDLLRFLLFLLFACLTGEVVYLCLVGAKTVLLFSHFIKIENEMYDLSWITYFYVYCAFLMSVLMFVWDCLGYSYDKKNAAETIPDFDFDFKNFNTDVKIVSYPSNSPYIIFMLTDFIGLLFWGFVFSIVVFDFTEIIMGFIGFFIIYGGIIATRLYGEYRINKSKIKVSISKYISKTKW